ncbi:MAG TPA: TolC family protein [Blastocatellia bacterium]|nr:TolC family protein [Blastocatellia bacterium]
MIKRRAQILFGFSILGLWFFPLSVGGQEIKQASEAQRHATRIDAGDKVVGTPQGNETGKSDLARIKIAGPLIAGWISGLDSNGPQASPSPPASSAQGALSFDEAVQLAIKNNLTSLLARERRNEARGVERESLAGLLPNLAGAASQTNLTINLASQGLTPNAFPLIPFTFLGPFNVFDARVQLVQTLFNLGAIRNYQAGRAGVNIAAIGEQLSRQQVITNTALAYLNALRTERAVAATEANLELAQTLLTLATDQHKSGVATGLDVTRAETRVAQQQFRLAQAHTEAYQARLQLQRVTGLPLGGLLLLTDRLAYTDAALPSAEAAVQLAQRQRVEIRLAEEQVKLNDYERRAAEAEQLPSIDFVGDYGSSGIKPNVLDLPTRSVGIRLSVPIFNGGLTRGRIAAATSRQRQAELQLNDLRAQVEQDVRLALQTLATAAEQVRAAEQALRLAERELQMARDRFQAGLGDNIEVVNAQTSLAESRDAQVAALTVHNAARINLASAMGRVESFRW